MERINFRPIELADCRPVQELVYTTDCRNCDLNFMNLMSWRFLFHTELAFCRGWLFFRFRHEGKLAYLPPVGTGDWSESLEWLMQDAQAAGEPFRLMGVCQHSLARLEATRPGEWVATADPSYSDYIYRREALATLAGKKLQPKRNHVNRFLKEHPDYDFRALQPTDFEECLLLVEKWHRQKPDAAPGGRLTQEEEQNALRFALEHWEALGGKGGVLRTGNRMVAFTYGAPINYDTFDICVEKADVDCEGAFAMVNREFARALPERYVYLNREEDLGIAGLRKAKQSYQPEALLHKHTVMLKKEAGGQLPEGLLVPMGATSSDTYK